MKRMLSRFTVVLAITLLALTSRGTLTPLAHTAQNPAPAKAEWTMLFYMDSDNDLEAPQMVDLLEMLRVGSTKDVNIVVLADRAEKYTNAPIANLKNWTTAKLLYVEQGKLRELADWGEVNMGDPAVLKKFLETGVKDFPAQRYGIVFGDHGMAWPGVCTDESHDHDFLTMQELPAALKDTATAIGKFELIGFDACLMANFEVAKAMAPLGRVMVASEEVEPGEGWNYTPLFQALTKNPKMTGAELGRTISDTFNDFFTKATNGQAHAQGAGVTLSVLALEKLDPLEKAINDLATLGDNSIKQKGREAWLKLAQARAQAEEYGKSGKSKDDPGLAVHDVIHFAQSVKQREASFAAASDAVIKATKDLVLYQIRGKGRPNANGISIFIPPDGETLMQKGPMVYSDLASSRSGKWLPFLKSYTGVQVQDTKPPQIQQPKTNDNSVDADDVIKVTAKVSADDIEEASFVLAISENNEQIIIGELPTEPDDNGVLEEEWDGQWFTLGDGEKEVICPVTNFEELDDAEDLYWAEVPAQVHVKGTDEWIDVTLYFIVDFNGEEVTGEFVYAYEDTDWGPREIELDTGDEVRPVYVSIDAQGDENLIASDDVDDILKISNDSDLVVGRQDVGKGKYLIGFAVSDYAGNYNEAFVDVTIE